MGEKRRERERRRKEVRLRETLAILDVLEWALRRLREIMGGC